MLFPFSLVYVALPRSRLLGRVAPADDPTRHALLEAGCLYGVHKLALEHEEQRHGRYSCHRGCRHDVVPRPRVLPLKARYAYLYHPQALVLGYGQGPEEAVPVGQEEEDRQGSEDRPAQGKYHAPINAPVAAAIYERRVLQLLGHPQVELSKEKNAEGVEDR